MKKTVFVVALAALSLAFAGTEEPKPEMVKIGGEGHFAFVNAAGVDKALLETAAGRVGKVLMINTSVQDGRWDFADAKKCLSETKASAAVFVVKDEKLPISLLAMEEKWGVVNAARLTDKGVTKEAMRVAAVLLGGATSKYKASVMRPVFSAEELDTKAGETLTIDTLMAIFPNVESVGIKQYQMYEYRDALDEGIAPPPANDAQRKIKSDWEKEMAEAAAKNKKGK